jgi:hypothetical protein
MRRNPHSTRALTAGEIALAREVFGDAVDCAATRVIHGKAFLWQPDHVAMAPDGRMYFPGRLHREDFSCEPSEPVRAMFVHELAHVMQHQQGVDVRACGLRIFLRGGYLARNVARTYASDPAAAYASLNIEQQATRWEQRYLELRRRGGSAPQRGE